MSCNNNLHSRCKCPWQIDVNEYWHRPPNTTPCLKIHYSPFLLILHHSICHWCIIMIYRIRFYKGILQTKLKSIMITTICYLIDQYNISNIRIIYHRTKQKIINRYIFSIIVSWNNSYFHGYRNNFTLIFWCTCL